MQENDAGIPEFNEVEPSGAAVARHFQEVGEQWDMTRQVMLLAGDRGYYVHNIQVRWPADPKKDVLLIVKMYMVDGPFVAFHSGTTWTHLIPGFAARMRTGSVNWLKDEYPPDNWTDKLKVIADLPRIRR